MNRMFYIASGFSDEYLANQMLFITKFRGPVTEREGVNIVEVEDSSQGTC